MKKILQLALLFLATLGLVRGAAAETRLLEMRNVDARVVRVKLDGVMEVRIRQGNVPSLSITADKRYIADVSTAQSGDTLHIETEVRGFKLGPSSIRADLVLPNLREVSSEGFGSTDITGFKGEELTLSLEGRAASSWWAITASSMPAWAVWAACSSGSATMSAPSWTCRAPARWCWADAGAS